MHFCCAGAAESACGAPSPPTVNAKLNGLVRLWRGDITRLEVDAIQNAANAQLSSGGGICGAIHKAAGPALATACKAIGDEPSKVIRVCFTLQTFTLIRNCITRYNTRQYQI